MLTDCCVLKSYGSLYQDVILFGFSFQVNDNVFSNNPLTCMLNEASTLTTPSASTLSPSVAKEISRSPTQNSAVVSDVRNNSTPQRSNKERQKKEDHLSSIFMGYVLVFLVCHTPRLVLSIYELSEIRRALECAR